MGFKLTRIFFSPCFAGLVLAALHSDCFLTAAEPARPPAGEIPARIDCAGVYPGHLQGICLDEKKNIYWSFTTWLVNAEGKWWFACYGAQLLTATADLQMQGRYTFECGYGIVALGSGHYDIARGGH